MPRRRYRRARRSKAITYSKTKQMVTGHGPTLLEKIAVGSGAVANVARAVMPAIAAINTEHKYFDQFATVSSHTPGTSDQLINLTSAIPQSISDSGRIGNSILAKQIQLRLAHRYNSTGPVLGVYARMMLICWKENANQNVPTIAKIFEQPANMYSPLNKDYTDQMVVIKDKFFALNSPTGVAGPSSFSTNKIFKKLNWHIRWDNANPSQNHVYLLLRCSAGSLTNALTTDYYSRVDYTDN